MTVLAQYILRVSAAAILNAVAQSFPLEGAVRGLVKLVGGVLMTLTLISPLLTLRLPDMESWLATFEDGGQMAAASGEEMAREAMHSIITEQTEAYILDKAAAVGAALEVQVRTDDAGVPVSVILHGNCTQEAKLWLSEMIASELGIGKEAQQWNS